MDWFAKGLIKSSLIWLAAGATLGLAIAMQPSWVIYRPAHLHMNLLGFVTMMIAGVGYHVFPRFVGQPLHSSRLAAAHLILANLGLALMVAGFVTRPISARPGAWLMGSGGLLSAIAIYLFVYNVWRTLDANRQRVAPLRERAEGVRRLPLADADHAAAP